MKCIGCGIKIQTVDPNLAGYVNELHVVENGEEIYCKRCFDIIHYNKKYVPTPFLKEFHQKMKQIRTKHPNDIVCLLVDVLDIYSAFSKEITELIGNLKTIILLNKIDLMPKSIKLKHLEEKVLSLAKEADINVLAVFPVSAKSKTNIEQVLRKIDKLRFSKYTSKTKFDNCYCIGNASVGKSTFINSVKELCGKNSPNITTSDQFQTTIDIIKVELGGKFFIHDTPGIINDGSFHKYLNYDSIKNLTPKSFIRVRTYQLKKMQTLFLGGLVKLDFLEGENISVSLFVANTLYVHRTKFEKSDVMFDAQRFKLLVPPFEEVEYERIKDLKTYDFAFCNDSFYDLVIPGVGFVHLKGENVKLKVSVFHQIEIKLVKSFL